jgi:hypothetical protein
VPPKEMAESSAQGAARGLSNNPGCKDRWPKRG